MVAVLDESATEEDEDEDETFLLTNLVSFVAAWTAVAATEIIHAALIRWVSNNNSSITSKSLLTVDTTFGQF